MGPRPAPLRVLVLFNEDFRQLSPDDPHYASLADVENAARGIASALASRGHRAELAGIDRSGIPALLGRLEASPPDVVFNLCESLDCDSRHEVVIPSLLELYGVPYTGSGAFAIGLALRKDRAKEVLRARGVPTPEAFVVEHELDIARGDLPFPLIVKPAREDASVGIEPSSVVRDRPALERACLRVLRDLAQPALVERYIEGRELYVSLLGNRPPRAFPFHEIDFTGLPEELPRIVSYAGKWDEGSPEFAFTRPTRCHLDEETRDRVEQAARSAFAALGLADYGRIDVRLASDGTPYVIDVNPNCDLSSNAGFSRAAGYGGVDYPSLIERVCLVALERHGVDVADHAPRPLEADDVVPLDAAALGPAASRNRGRGPTREAAPTSGPRKRLARYR